MTITLTKNNYNDFKQEIRSCARGEFCKIMRVDDPAQPHPIYLICADTTAGWTTSFGRAFHASELDGNVRKTGLGVFLMIRETQTPDGSHTLEFTDDLNPDIA